jgi:hypothetical protein
MVYLHLINLLIHQEWRSTMSAADGGAPYDVGFAKPPKQSRFRKGSSGNPRGRPKGRPNVATVLERRKTKTRKLTRPAISQVTRAIKGIINNNPFRKSSRRAHEAVVIVARGQGRGFVPELGQINSVWLKILKEGDI